MPFPRHTILNNLLRPHRHVIRREPILRRRRPPHHLKRAVHVRPAAQEPALGKRDGPEPVVVGVGDTTEDAEGGTAFVGDDRFDVLAVGVAESVFGEGVGCVVGLGGRKVVNWGDSVNKSE